MSTKRTRNRITHTEFFQICDWLKDKLLVIPSRKTVNEMAIIFSDSPELKTAGVRFPISDGSIRQICRTVGYKLAKTGQYPRGKVKSQTLVLFRKRLEEIERRQEVLEERLDLLETTALNPPVQDENIDDVLLYNEAKDEEEYYAEKARDEEAAKDKPLFDMRGDITRGSIEIVEPKDVTDEETPIPEDNDYEPKISITASSAVQDILRKYKDDEEEEEEIELPED